MTDGSSRPGEAAELRRLAEERLVAKGTEFTPPQAAAGEQRLVHELQVHQIELEMQNEELRRARADLEEALKRYTDLYDFAPVGYFTLDRDGAISQLNLAGARMLGLERARLVGRRFRSFVFQADLPAFDSFLKRALASSEKESREVRLLTKADRPLYVQMEASGIAEGQRCLVAAMDVTERQRAEEEREELRAAEQKARAEAEAAVRVRDEFISVAAHELKTPVTSLQGFAQVVHRELERSGTIDRGRLANAMQRIVQQSKRLTMLSEQLLNVSRIRSGKLALSREKANLSDLSRRVVADMRLAHPGRTIELRDEGRELVLPVDPLRLEQVLVNLIDNALKFSPRDSKVDVEVDGSEAGWVKIAVRDRGRGIAEEQRGRVFERFYQEHPEGHYGGMGIGLYISREIVEMHGGSIEVEQPEDGGSSFIIRLPRGQSSEQASDPGGGR